MSSLEEDSGAGEVRWLVGVTDEAMAQGELLRLVLNYRGVRVVSFGQRRYSLEEAFFGLVEGDEDDGG